jgi:hypothetical protein
MLRSLFDAKPYTALRPPATLSAPVGPAPSGHRALADKGARETARQQFKIMALASI